jgi:hypothetical protein
MPEDPKKASFSADDITTTDLARRSFLRRLGRVGLVAPALPLLAACGGSDSCDTDVGDAPSAQGSDTDSGDPCDSD